MLNGAIIVLKQLEWEALGGGEMLLGLTFNRKIDDGLRVVGN